MIFEKLGNKMCFLFLWPFKTTNQQTNKQKNNNVKTTKSKLILASSQTLIPQFSLNKNILLRRYALFAFFRISYHIFRFKVSFTLVILSKIMFSLIHDDNNSLMTLYLLNLVSTTLNFTNNFLFVIFRPF